jgi:Carboxypeptidase regulatory-like domain/TonB-dependent Receptor Plug Domain
MRRYVGAAILFGLLIVNTAFSQNAQLAGSVSDASNALIPGVTIIATNNATGVATTTITNDSGAYTFPSLQPGVYKLSAELPGFQTSTVTNLELGPIAVRQNFQLKVGTAATSVEVTGEPLTAVSQSSATVGDVLSQKKVSDLPIVGNNVLSVLDTLPGLRVSTSSGGGLMGPQFATINGLDLNSVNVTRDGLTTNDTRFSSAGDVTAGVAIPHGGGIGVMSPTTINPDLVGEVRLILSPIDAELGRGNSQIQIQTRSGTNQFRGAAAWNVINNALNANTWTNNKQISPQTGAWSPLRPDWRNVHDYTLSYGGPIVKNKTFFYALWDQNISHLRATVNAHVLTNEARQGIFRFWEGWLGRGADPSTNTSLATAAGIANPQINSVDFAGKPLRPPTWPDSTPYTGRLLCFSVFGNVKLDGSPFTSADCPSGTDSAGRAYTAVAMLPPGASTWDPKRPTQFNTSGQIAKVLAAMPQANNFFDPSSDGLNLGTDRWLRTLRIGDPTFYNETLIGNDPYSNRKQFNIKIDHNFNARNRINGSWTPQWDDNLVLPGEWQKGVSGLSYRRPQIITLGVTSTLSPTLLNEAKFGYHINKGSQIPPWQSSNSSIQTQALQNIGQGGVRPGGSAKFPVLVRPATGCLVFGTTGDEYTFDNGNMGMRLNCGVIVPNLLNDPLWEYVDTVSWTHGKHAFKFGGDLRFPRTDGYAYQPYIDAPYGNLGGTATLSPLSSQTAGTGTPSLGFTTLQTGQGYSTGGGNIFRQTSRTDAANLAYILTDSIGSLNTPYWIDSQKNKDAGIPGWKDVTTENNRYRSTISHDLAFFVKDDFKVTKDLTVNLGLRYEYYAPPYLDNGLTATAAGLGSGLFGASRGAGGQLFNSWLQPGNLFLTNYGNQLPAGSTPLDCKSGVKQSALLPSSSCDPSTLTAIQFVGPQTTNPDQTVLSRNRKNFGPAIGFAWQLPWFGAEKTTVRGGYSIQYERLTVRDDILASAPGNTLNQVAAVTDPDIAALIATRAVNYTDLATIAPRLPQVAPGLPTPVYAKQISFTAYDPHLRNPYVQNLTLSVTRSLHRNGTLDVRYIGTLARESLGSFDLNTSTVYYNPELFNALQVTRAGGNDPLFDQMFAGLRLSGVAATVLPVDGITSRGSDQLRLSTATQANLANGNYVAVANALITPATLTIAAGGSGISGLSPGPAFAILHNGCDRLANGATNLPTRCFPENYLTANPQLNAATYVGNLGRSDYHALQVSYTLRPTNGFSVQTTYSFAKSMQLGGGGGPGLADAGTAGAGFGTNGYTDPLNRNQDRIRGLDSLHNMRMNGTIELPVGPGKLLLANAHGWAGRVLEHWQTSFILNLGTGTPASITGAGAMRYGNPRYNVTNDWKLLHGKAAWNGPNGTGTYFGNNYVAVKDPQCLDTTVVAASLTSFCTLSALANTASGSPVNVLVNPKPGEIGTLGNRVFDGPGIFYLDGNIAKSFRLTETKQLSIRLDATNILNHPQLMAPTFGVGGATAFGNIPGKGTTIFGQATPVQRNFQGQIRLSF